MWNEHWTREFCFQLRKMKRMQGWFITQTQIGMEIKITEKSLHDIVSS